MSSKIVNDKKNYRCFCDNCKTKSNNYRCFNMPITSVGIVAYYHDTFENKNKYLLIRRRDSLGYVDFLRGKYNLQNNTHLQNLVNEMTLEEKQKLKQYDFDKLWKEMWNNCKEKIDLTSKKKFDLLKHNTYNNTADLNYYINNSNTKWNEPEWGFPKGRRNQNEKDYNAALREFSEETGILTSKIKIIQNIKPLEECFIGSNYKSYKHKYYIAKILLNKNENIFDVVTTDNFQKTEVSDIGFYTYQEAVEKFRKYNAERCILINDIDILLNKYEIE